MVEKAAVSDAKQPSSNILDVGKLVRDSKRFEKGFLRQLVSEGTIPTESAQEGPDRALVGADNRVECVDL